MSRRRAIGAELLAGGVDFRVWAPARRSVSVVIDGEEHPLDRETDGHFRGVVAGAQAGTRYRFRLDDEGETYPDPAARFQPEGPHGPSEVVDSTSYRWTNALALPPTMKAAVIYEIHIGTFTPEGTWRAAIDKLTHLRDAGVTIIEVMPVAEFPGRFGWGYDGVDLWAPAHFYGAPDDFRAFVDAAHSHGLGVILDVVYNHFGPDGCYLSQFSPSYFTRKYDNEWGEAINFDGEGAEGVREFFAENAAYWIDEFRLDGLRLDATQSIHDDSAEHVISVINRAARAAAGDRSIVIVGENEGQNIQLIVEYGLDALWNDDWHHVAMVAATGLREAYYTDYFGGPQEFVSMAKHGFLYQGQRYSWQKHRRGSRSLGLPREKLICYLQNHDQIANSQRGERIQFLTSPGRHRALTALLLLGPNTPMLFQGQEFAASAPFIYFADHKPELAEAVASGRREFLRQFPSITGDVARPDDPRTFERCKLDWSERERNADALALHRELLRLRRPPTHVDGAVLGAHAFVLRFTPERLLLVNLGDVLHLDVVSEPLLAPPPAQRWQLVWSSEPVAEVEDVDGRWTLPAESAVVMEPSPG
ncbi:MAG: malto-oligosyltrehalose trehalohydrolase [Acidobacteriota bacterium]